MVSTQDLRWTDRQVGDRRKMIDCGGEKVLCNILISLGYFTLLRESLPLRHFKMTSRKPVK